MAPSSSSSSAEENSLCGAAPSLVSSFVDAFVDFVVGGQFVESQEPALPPRTRRPPAERIVAIGDIHGDFGKAREALRIAGIINHTDSWTGGSTTAVQVGDLLDRGSEELRVVYLLEKLARDARRAGGELIIMNGNHEIMNIEGDFRYVTPAACFEFQNWAHWYQQGNLIKELCDGIKRSNIHEDVPADVPIHLRSRYAALRPGGPISSRFLAHHPTVLMVGGTVFVHGGILPSHAEYGLERMNEEVSSWICGKAGRFGPNYLHGKDAIVWARQYSEPKEQKCDCEMLDRALQAIPGSTRMIVGHTIQKPSGINGVCMNQVIRVDVGMSAGCGNAPPEVLEIRNDEQVKVLGRAAERDLESKKGPLLKDRGVGLAGILSE